MRIISQAPCRISMFGGGTDVAPFCEEHGGLVINMAINLRNEVVINTDVLDRMTVNPLFKRILEDYKVKLGAGLSVGSREKGAGIGSSGSFAVATIGAVRAYLGMELNKHEIAREAFELETEKLGWHGGCQDQFASAYGGFNLMEINGDVAVHPLSKKVADELVCWMVLMDTGVRRQSYKIQEGFKKLSTRQVKALMKLKEMVIRARGALNKRDFVYLGELLKQTWKEKKKSNEGITNRAIESLFAKAMGAGALGGKICGAGGGGYCWFLVDPKDRKEFIRQMGDNMDFSIDYNGLEVRNE